MIQQQMESNNSLPQLKSDCKNCFGLCCVALPYSQSADFAFNKDGGTPCRNLQSDFTCRIHQNLITSGFKGCTVYECYGAGQKVSQMTFNGVSWRESSSNADEMFQVFPIMQQLHEMLYYIHESLYRKEAEPLYGEIKVIFEKTIELTQGSVTSLFELDIPAHRSIVSNLLQKVSELVRRGYSGKGRRKKIKGTDLIGQNFKDMNLEATSFKGAYLIGANLRNANLRRCDFLGADLRDTDLSGADLTNSIFLTQSQVNAAKGDKMTNLPDNITRPQHW